MQLFGNVCGSASRHRLTHDQLGAAFHDLGGIDPEEIAVSVIAEIVQTRNRRAHLTGSGSSGSGSI